jgi:hypothetical protein
MWLETVVGKSLLGRCSWNLRAIDIGIGSAPSTAAQTYSPVDKGYEAGSTRLSNLRLNGDVEDARLRLA